VIKSSEALDLPVRTLYRYFITTGWPGLLLIKAHPFFHHCNKRILYFCTMMVQ